VIVLAHDIIAMNFIAMPMLSIVTMGTGITEPDSSYFQLRI